MKLSSVAVAVIVVVSIFGTIGATALTGVWQTEGDRVPRLITDGEYEGSYDPADIRGSYTFADIESAFAVPATKLAEADMDIAARSGLTDVRVELPSLSGSLVAEGVETDAASEGAVAATTLSETYETSEDETMIKGRTTFADLLGWGVTQDAIEEVIGGPMPARGTTIGDYASQQGIEFSGWKERLQSLVDSL